MRAGGVVLLLLIVFSGYAIIRTAVPPWWVSVCFRGVCGCQRRLVCKWVVHASCDKETASHENKGARMAGAYSEQLAVISMPCQFTHDVMIERSPAG